MLSDAYSKAIKYTARLRSKDTALRSRVLLDEMISRHGISSESWLFSLKSHGAGNEIEIHDKAISQMIETFKFDDNGTVVNNSEDWKEQNLIMSTAIPPPTKRDYHNIIHSWASSKAKKKGLHAETLLWRMMELSTLHPGYFDFPDSRTFALVIKCYAGSTCA
jgi:hypothetical protein